MTGRKISITQKNGMKIKHVSSMSIGSFYVVFRRKKGGKRKKQCADVIDVFLRCKKKKKKNEKIIN
jgi:hypothetical protein